MSTYLRDLHTKQSLPLIEECTLTLAVFQVLHHSPDLVSGLSCFTKISFTRKPCHNHLQKNKQKRFYVQALLTENCASNHFRTLNSYDCSEQFSLIFTNMPSNWSKIHLYLCIKKSWKSIINSLSGRFHRKCYRIEVLTCVSKSKKY